MTLELMASLAALITAIATAIGSIAAAKNRKVEAIKIAAEAHKTEVDVTGSIVNSADTMVKNYQEMVESLQKQFEVLQEKFIALETENRKTSYCVSVLSDKNDKLMRINSRFIRGIKTLMAQVVELNQIPRWQPSEDDLAEIEEISSKGEK